MTAEDEHKAPFAGVAWSLEVDPATGDLADRSICRNCGEPIVWDDYSYVHESNGWGDCNTLFVGGTLSKTIDVGGVTFEAPPGTVFRIDPDIIQGSTPEEQMRKAARDVAAVSGISEEEAYDALQRALNTVKKEDT